jgi:AraC-like DNA-binding protein
MDRRVETAILIIRERLHRNLPVRELAGQVNLSHWYFIHLFKAETSVSPKQYVRKLKMKQAEDLLDQSFLSVKEIAASLGFEDRSQFSRDFKRFCGCAPTEFRARQHRESAGNSRY